MPAPVHRVKPGRFHRAFEPVLPGAQGREVTKAFNAVVNG
jgi:hypothetical protein